MSGCSCETGRYAREPSALPSLVTRRRYPSGICRAWCPSPAARRRHGGRTALAPDQSRRAAEPHFTTWPVEPCPSSRHWMLNTGPSDSRIERMIVDLYIPTRVIFGRGRLAELGQQATAFGHRVLLVSGRTAMQRHGILDTCVRLLEESGADVSVFASVSEDPTSEEVDRGIALAHREKCDVIVGLGGGSAIDAAKAASAGLKAGPVGPLVGTSLELAEQMVPVIAVPTTAGSGAEVTKGAIITDPSRALKAGIPWRLSLPCRRPYRP